MNSTWIAAVALPLAAMSLPLASAQGTHASNGRGFGRLVQVAPLEPGGSRVTGGPGGGTVDVEFSSDEWLRRLTDFDLDLRERNFEEIVALARREPKARAWLRERAADTVDPELTWTARLALREVDRRGPAGAMFFRAPGSPGADDAFGDVRDRMGRLRERMEKGFSPLLPPGGPSGPGGSSQSRSVAIEETPSGVKVAVTDVVDGEETTREYEAPSFEALLEAHPELEGDLGNGALRVRIGTADPILDVDGMRLELEQLFQGLDLLHRGTPAPRHADARPIRTDVLGVYVASPSPALATRLGLEPNTGLVVHGTMPGTIAHVLGIGPGNVLVELNGTALHSFEEISKVLRERPSDGEVTVVWYDSFGDRRRQTWMPVEATREE